MLSIDNITDNDIELAIEELIQRDYFNGVAMQNIKQKKKNRSKHWRKSNRHLAKAVGVN